MLFGYFSGTIGSRVARMSSLDWDWHSLDLSRVDDPTLDLPFTEEEIRNTISELPGGESAGS